MSTSNVPSSGYIVEFNRDTGLGVIEENATKRLLLVHSNSFKGRSKRYLQSDNQYVGELFDFDIMAKPKDNADAIDTFEAVNVRHRVLKCNVEGCSRLKAFTHIKALEEHINIRHTQKQKEKLSKPLVVATEKSKKERPTRPKPILISLSPYTRETTSIIGRFIGKQGVNLKRFQQQNHIKLQLLDRQKASHFVQIRMTPLAGVTTDIKSITKKLKSEWERCVCGQKLSEETHKQRLELRHSSEEEIVSESEGDSRYKDNSRFSYGRKLRQQAFLSRRKSRQSESLVKVQGRHSSLNQEGRRSIATCASEYRQKSIFNYSQPKKAKKIMKESQWLIKEQLQDLKLAAV